MTLSDIIGPIFFALILVGGVIGLLALLRTDLLVQAAIKSHSKTPSNRTK